MVSAITTVGQRQLAYYATVESLFSRLVQVTHSLLPILFACLRGIEIEADVVLKATKVDGVYSADPTKDPDAVLYETLTYQDVLERELKVMDLAAFTLARDHNLPIRVFNMNKPGALRRVVMGESEGTLISHA